MTDEPDLTERQDQVLRALMAEKMAAPMPRRSHGHSVVQPEIQIDCGFRYFGAVLSTWGSGR